MVRTLTIDDVALKDKKVLVRVDFNVPMTSDLKVSDDKRIVEALPTIRKILNSDGSAILMSHLGRPKGQPNPEFSLQPVANHLSILLNIPVKFAKDCIGKATRQMVGELRPREVLMLENLRFYMEEETNNE